MPLGSAALAGTNFPIDRHHTAKLLGFPEVTHNSIDGVSDRDFIVEFCSAASLLMMHLSRFCEEIVIWSTSEFAFMELSDAFTTGSSIMPQKKNPDVPELVRGKSGRVTGHLLSLLMLMKSQPLAYNKDNQEDKEPLFDTVDTLKGSLRVFGDMMPAVEIKHANMAAAAKQGFSTATDLADYLVRKGIAFRDAHEIVGRAVRHGVETGKDLSVMSLQELQAFSDVIDADVFAVLTLQGSMSARDHTGGTAPAQVRAAAAAAGSFLRPGLSSSSSLSLLFSTSSSILSWTCRAIVPTAPLVDPRTQSVNTIVPPAPPRSMLLFRIFPYLSSTRS